MGKKRKNSILREYGKVFKNETKLYDIIQKAENGISLQNLQKSEEDNLWMLLYELIKKEYDEENLEEKEKYYQIHDGIIEIYMNMLMVPDLSPRSYPCIRLMQEVIDDYIQLKVKNLNYSYLLNVCEKWLKNEKLLEIQGMAFVFLETGFMLCGSGKVSTILNKLNACKKVLLNLNEIELKKLKNKFISAMTSSVFLTSETGNKILSALFTINEKLTKELYELVCKELSKCDKKKSECYGNIFALAWTAADDVMKGIIMNVCFRGIMKQFILSTRTSLELPKSSQNLIIVLEIWHNKRKNNAFFDMIVEAYTPFLWKYLKDSNNSRRCNAAELFFKTFPLVQNNAGHEATERAFYHQYETMSQFLLDDTPVIRMMAVREVCNILVPYWSSFLPQQIKSLLTIITQQDAHDVSSADVRRMVYVGLEALLKEPQAAEYLMSILPHMADNIHDFNEKVRIAFIRLLIAIKQQNNPSLNIYKIVDINHLLHIIGEDTDRVGILIMELIFTRFYRDDVPAKEWLKKFIYVIVAFPNSYRNFITYSRKKLKFESAKNIMTEILTRLGEYVIFKSTDENADKSMESNIGGKKKKCVLQDQNSESDDTDDSRTGAKRKRRSKEQTAEQSNREEKTTTFDNPAVVVGLLDMVNILWVMFYSKLKNDDSELKALYGIFLKYAQPLINYYKETPVFLSIISLTGHVPASSLRKESITVPGYCINTLKKLKADDLKDKTEDIICILWAVVKWNRGCEVLELINMSIDAAFKTQNLNQTVIPNRRVKLQDNYKPDSVVAVALLNHLIIHENIKAKIMSKNKELVMDIWKKMAKVQDIIITRLNTGYPFEDSLLSDQFLMDCFKRYVKLIPVLAMEYKTEEGYDLGVIDHRQELMNLISWCTETLVPYLDQRERSDDTSTVLCSVVQDVLFVIDNMIMVDMIEYEELYSKLMFQLLDSPYKVQFVSGCLRLVVVSCNQVKFTTLTTGDMNSFWSTIVPTQLNKILDALTEVDDLEVMTLFQDTNEKEIKKMLMKILLLYHDIFFKTNFSHVINIISSIFVTRTLQLFAKQITSENVGNLKYEISPTVRLFINLFKNKLFWSQNFLFCLHQNLSIFEFDIKQLLASIFVINLLKSDKKLEICNIKKVLLLVEDKLKKSEEMRKMVGVQVLLPVLTDNTNTGSQMSKETELLELPKVPTESTQTQTSTQKTWASTGATWGDSNVPRSQEESEELLYDKGYALINQIRQELVAPPPATNTGTVQRTESSYLAEKLHSASLASVD